jgi:hypothetical protein
MKIHRIEAKVLRDYWIDGRIDEFRFQAKIYDTGSKYGIGGGRVSKLEVWDEKAQELGIIIAYDRGWSTKPATAEHKSILRALLGYAKALPNGEYWEELAGQKPFYAKMRLKDGSHIDTRIAVSANGYGTALDLPEGISCRRLNPITVWELKMQETAGETPCYAG